MTTLKARAYQSIQDFLAAIGFSIDQDQHRFSKWTEDQQQISIPFSELSGHTVTTFFGKARRRGWFSTEESTSPTEETFVSFV